ncbi:MAG: DUF5011 domain-containing protein [Clostridia bacterium]|nr:DUF5011 domain-containing protein [Clostridia bacterium]
MDENMRKLNKKKVLLFVLILILFFFIISRLFSKDIQIKLNGPSTIDIEFGSTYSEQYATATYGKKDISDTIEVSGAVDTTKIGSYKITYTAKQKKNTKSITRTINIKDTVSPTLTLTGDNEINIAQGSTYQELGCIATDNYDGDLTTKISIENQVDTNTKGTYIVKYNVTDSSGNSANISRTINVVSANSSDVSTKKATGLPVLMYHFFYDKDAGESGKDSNYMEIHDFEDQLKYLSENNYYFPTWDEVKNYVDGTSCLPEHSIVITVDDGDESFFRLAAPVIEKYDVKVTSFVVTSWIENANYLKEFSSSGKIIFQSHSNDMHQSGDNGKGKFLSISEKDALDDLNTSKSFIGNATVFCYPFGHYNDKCVEILKKAGFELAFTTEYARVRPGQNPYELSRIRMSKGDSLQSFIQRVS